MQSISYQRHRFPAEVIRHAVWLYFRFTLSLRDVEELLAERGIEVSYETIRCWTLKLGPLIARNLRRRQARPTGRWHIDEMMIKIGGQKRWLWRAVDDEGVVLDMLVQRRRNKKAALRLICKLMKNTGVHLPMTKWLQAIHLMCASRKGISSHQLMRILQTTYRTAWHLSHGIREAMRSGDLAPFGGEGQDVEVDETYIGREPGTPKAKGGTAHKMKVLSLVDRSTGRARSMVVDDTTAATVAPIVQANIAKEVRLLTDQSRIYTKVGAQFAAHGTVDHSRDEYVSRVDPTIHTNTIEGYSASSSAA